MSPPAKTLLTPDRRGRRGFDRPVLWLVGFLALAFWAGPARAEIEAGTGSPCQSTTPGAEAVPVVGVEAAVDIPAMTQQKGWQPGRVASLSRELAAALSVKLGSLSGSEAWCFLPALGAEKWLAKIKIQQVELDKDPKTGEPLVNRPRSPQRRSVTATLELWDRTGPHPRQKANIESDADLWRPDEFRYGIGTSPERAAEELAQQLRDRFLLPQMAEIVTSLRAVPVAARRATCPEAEPSSESSSFPMLELPLRVLTEELANAWFRIDCRFPKAVGQVMVQGNGRMESTPPLTTIPNQVVLPGKEAFAILAREVETHLGKLDLCKLDVVSILLTGFEERTGARRAEVGP